MLWKCCTQYASKFIILSSGYRTEKGVFIPIPKKDNAKECSNYCTIALISHTSKVMLKILQARLQQVYVKVVHCHPVYLTYVQSTSCEMPGWMKHKLESRLWEKYPITFSKTSLNIRKFTVLLKHGLETFVHYFTSVWDECKCAVVWTFFEHSQRMFGTGMKTDFFQSCGHCWVFKFADILSEAF